MKKVAKRIKKSASKRLSHLRKIIFASTASTVISIVAIVVIISGAVYAAYVATGHTTPSVSDDSTSIAELPQSKLLSPAASSSGGSKNIDKKDGTSNPSSSPKPSSSPSSAAKGGSSSQTGTQPTTNSTTPGTSPASTQCPYRAFDPYFPASAVRTNGSTTITYTVSFTIVPICASFGNPTIDVTITKPIGSSYSSPCINITDSYWGTVSYSRRYNGNNSLTISCVVKVTPPTDISQHYLAPLPSGSGFAVNVSATLENGQIVNGGEGKNYYLESGYDRL